MLRAFLLDSSQYDEEIALIMADDASDTGAEHIPTPLSYGEIELEVDIDGDCDTKFMLFLICPLQQ